MVVVGASSGGVEALIKIARGLPADLPAAVFAVVHFPQGVPSVLPRILDRSGPLSAAHPEDGEVVSPGRIYVAPPGFHLLLERDDTPLGRVRLGRGPKENHNRPAVDALFRSAAVAHGPRVVGVVLTGALDDGTAGLLAVKRRGGVAVVQDPKDALFPGMPESALRYATVDHRLPLEKLPSLLDRLCREPAVGLVGEREGENLPEDMEFEVKAAGLDPSVLDGGEHAGELSGYTCPECSGPLYEIRDAGFVRFRCRVGHAHTAESVLEGKDEALENALYAALNTLEESAEMSDNLAAVSRDKGNTHAAARFEERALETRRRATTIRGVLVGQGAVPAQAASSP